MLNFRNFMLAVSIISFNILIIAGIVWAVRWFLAYEDNGVVSLIRPVSSEPIIKPRLTDQERTNSPFSVPPQPTPSEKRSTSVPQDKTEAHARGKVSAAKKAGESGAKADGMNPKYFRADGVLKDESVQPIIERRMKILVAKDLRMEDFAHCFAVRVCNLKNGQTVDRAELMEKMSAMRQDWPKRDIRIRSAAIRLNVIELILEMSFRGKDNMTSVKGFNKLQMSIDQDGLIAGMKEEISLNRPSHSDQFREIRYKGEYRFSAK